MGKGSTSRTSATLRLAMALATAAGLSACSESHMEEPDAAIVFDLDSTVPMPDAGTDAGMGEGTVGVACGSEADCTAPTDICLSDPDFLPGGYCSRACVDDSECPGGSTCVQLGGGEAYCMLSCDPASTERQCRAGYGCASGAVLPPVCVAGCSDATDCGEGQMCDPSGGFIGAGTCFDPASATGDACADDGECPAGHTCYSEPLAGWPGGSCLGTDGCDPASGMGCAMGAACVPVTGGGICADSCTTDADCRAEYTCRAVTGFPGRSYCAPGCASDAECTDGRVCNVALGTCAPEFDEAQLGGQCNTRTGEGCVGGTCLAEGTAGYPGSYCAYQGCTVGDAASCPAGGVCSPTSDGRGVCLDGCAADTDCRAAYACRPADPTNAASPTACVPACTGAMGECSARAMRVCNVGTGLCGAAFMAGNLGEPCASAAECPGGRCHTETAEGWPAGTCALVGCRLSGEGPAVECPMGSTCVDDGSGYPEIGECLESCTVATTSCRPGYACEPLDIGGTDGVCRPGCASDGECASPRTCDEMTGLCS